MCVLARIELLPLIVHYTACAPESAVACGVEKAVLAELCAVLRYSTCLCDDFFKCISNLKGACQLHAARQAALALISDTTGVVAS